MREAVNYHVTVAEGGHWGGEFQGDFPVTPKNKKTLVVEGVKKVKNYPQRA